MALPAAMVITKKIIVPAGQREEELELAGRGRGQPVHPVRARRGQPRLPDRSGPAPNNPEEVEVLIAASRKEKVEDRVAVAEAAGLKPLVMDVESYATQDGVRADRAVSCRRTAATRTSRSSTSAPT